VLTRVAVTTFYPVAVWVLAVGDPALGALIMAAFGVGRALPLVVVACIFDNAEDSAQFEGILHRYKPALHLVNGLVLATAGWCLIVSGFTSG
jgi:cytochrome c biogenesis protein CcdA